MSDGWTKAIKWVIALLVLGLVAVFTLRWGLQELQQAVEIDTGPPVEEEVDLAEEEPVTQPGAAHAVAAFTVTGGTVTALGAETLVIGADAGELAVVVFEAVAPDPACLTRAVLNLQQRDLVSEEPLTVEAAPAVPPALGELEEGAELGEAMVRLEVPEVQLLPVDAEPVVRQWDVLPLYAHAAREAVEPGAVAFALRVTEEAGQVVFAGLADPEGLAPSIEYDVIADCEELFGPVG